MSNITVVLAADTGYAEQVHTLMKSICTHNTNVDFYLMHNTFRKEWINYTNQKLAASGSRLNDVKIEMDFSQYRRLSHISDAAFFRLMMQHLPVDRALYLDSDMVVTQSLRFVQPRYTRLSRCGGTRFRFGAHRVETPYRPAHHTLFQFRHVAGRLGAMAGTQYRGATAKNRRLSQRSRTLWRPMFLKYRLPKQLAGIERVLELPNRRSRIFPKTKPRRSIPKPDTVPPVIHYTTRAKPWLCDYSEIPFIEVYWQYYCADWPNA